MSMSIPSKCFGSDGSHLWSGRCPYGPAALRVDHLELGLGARVRLSKSSKTSGGDPELDEGGEESGLGGSLGRGDQTWEVMWK